MAPGEGEHEPRRENVDVDDAGPLAVPYECAGG